MRYIHKSGAPVSFEKYKLQKGASYLDLGNNAPLVKDELRTTLMHEQGYICGYCGSRIDAKNSVIEHIKSRSKYPDLQLDYMNMICSCNGGQKMRSKNPQYPLHCDAHKGNQDIPVSPIDLRCGDLFVYDDDGGIHDNNSIDANITIEILKLDNEKLINRRKAAIYAYKYLSDEDTDWSVELQYVQNYQVSGKYSEFCFVLEYYIRNYKMPVVKSDD